MNFKLFKHNTILVFRVTQISGSSLSDKLLFNTVISIDLSPNSFEERKKPSYFFYNQVRNHINSFVIKNKVKQLLNCKLKSNINDSNKYALNLY